MSRPFTPLIVRFWSKVDPCRTDGCYIWVAGRQPNGYGKMGGGGRGQFNLLAHHVLVGKPPAGLTWDHLCRVRNCVNPDHLELVTFAENVRRGNAGLKDRIKTHCPRGHEYTEENTRHYRGKRFCRECQRSYHQRRLTTFDDATH